ncbi:AAA family ATPase [Cellulosimicrobium marinum]|uniref:AAA family ATPase n=1 Tax=Cellulosimicrobium marinum TaxID=1638992 RepID=UPI001E2F5685|nr:AAA family ATPase [Cellulosimicrobium marinum]MCB7135698.1 AAA family ATPase [Cellulosimicrobium marinum]
MEILGPDDDVVEHLGDVPRRITVVGVSGAGKSTLAARLAVRLGLPYTDVDGLHHGPGWVPRPEFLDDVRALLAQESFVVEWQFAAARPLILERAQLVVWLDLPSRVTMRQVVGRTWRRSVRREVLWNGNVEPPIWRSIFRPAEENIVRWAWGTRHKYRDLPASLAEQAPHVVLVRLRSRREVDRWVRRLPAPPGG